MLTKDIATRYAAALDALARSALAEAMCSPVVAEYARAYPDEGVEMIADDLAMSFIELRDELRLRKIADAA
jgi:hypothetical protein